MTYTIELTEDQLQAVKNALSQYRAFAVYGDGREEHQSFVQKIIEKFARLKTKEAA